jgi:hypothetical protein
MRYTAAALTSATRPVTITIGRVSNRRGVRWLSRWWVTRCRTWHAKPLSVPQMLALQAAGRDPLTYLVALAGLLRAVLPRRWWYRLVGDPVRMILTLPPSLLPLVLQALVTAPGSDRDVTHDEDPMDQLRRDQRRAVYGDERTAKGGVTLAVAALSVRAAYGDGWYYAPDRWPTSDGYVPFAVALVEYAGVQSLDVRRRLEFADGYGIAHAKDPRRVRQQMEALAYPVEVC